MDGIEISLLVSWTCQGEENRYSCGYSYLTAQLEGCRGYRFSQSSGRRRRIKFISLATNDNELFSEDGGDRLYSGNYNQHDDVSELLRNPDPGHKYLGAYTEFNVLSLQGLYHALREVRKIKTKVQISTIFTTTTLLSISPQHIPISSPRRSLYSSSASPPSLLSRSRPSPSWTTK